MPRKKRCASPPIFDDFEEDFEDEDSSNGSRSNAQPPIQRNAANARERARMRVLSSAFCKLKTKLPWVPADTKLSKLDTLRLATIYIQQLRSSLSTDAHNDNVVYNNVPSAQSLVWPFTFQQNVDSNRPPMPAAGLCQWLNASRIAPVDTYHQQQPNALNGRNNFVNSSTAQG